MSRRSTVTGMDTPLLVPEQRTGSVGTLGDGFSPMPGLAGLVGPTTKSVSAPEQCELAALAERMRSGLSYEPRTWRMRRYEDCMIGKEGVDWLVRNRALWPASEPAVRWSASGTVTSRRSEGALPALTTLLEFWSRTSAKKTPTACA